MATNRVIFFINKETHILDLAGAVQTFYESGDYGKPYEIIYASDNVTQATSAHLQMTGLKKYTTIKIISTDIIVIPGYDLRRLPPMDDHRLFAWLRKADKAGAILCSICTGAFTLAAAGLLEGKECTTHWKYTTRLQKDYPALKVLSNRLFVKSGNIYASAGVTTPLANPTLSLRDANGNVIASNDNWKDSQQAAIAATGKAPPNDNESAILGLLAPGNYTAIVAGKNGTTGVALIEFYSLP